MITKLRAPSFGIETIGEEPKVMTIDEALEAVSVEPQLESSDDLSTNSLIGWYPVSTDQAGGIIAYFADETMAYAFRLFLINAMINPLEV